MSTAPKPWLEVGEAPPLDLRIFTLRRKQVADPRNGRQYERVVLDGTDWVNVIAVTPDDTLVMVRQFRFGSWTNTLEIPGGMVDRGEDPAVAAARELEEETGYRPAAWKRLGSTLPNPAVFTNRLHSYLATGCVKVHDGRPDGSEDIAVELVPRAAIRDLVRSGEIDHALVLVAFLLESWG